MFVEDHIEAGGQPVSRRHNLNRQGMAVLPCGTKMMCDAAQYWEGHIQVYGRPLATFRKRGTGQVKLQGFGVPIRMFRDPLREMSDAVIWSTAR